MLLTRTSQRYPLIQSHVVSDNGSLTDYDTVSVVDEESLSNLCAGMYLDTCLSYSPLRHPSGPEIMALFIQFMCNPIVHHNLEAGIQKNLHGRMDSRIPLSDNSDFFLYIMNESHNESHLTYQFKKSSLQFPAIEDKT